MQNEDHGRPMKPHRSGGGHSPDWRGDYDKCPYCDTRRPVVAGPSDPRPYVCLSHRHMVPRRDFA